MSNWHAFSCSSIYGKRLTWTHGRLLSSPIILHWCSSNSMFQWYTFAELCQRVSFEDSLNSTHNLSLPSALHSLQSMMQSEMNTCTWSPVFLHSWQHDQQNFSCSLLFIHHTPTLWHAVEEDLELLGVTLCTTDLSVPLKLVCKVFLSTEDVMNRSNCLIQII